jgi:hypothetical protein
MGVDAIDQTICPEVAAVSRNRYSVQKPVDIHKILINAIKFYVCLQEI